MDRTTPASALLATSGLSRRAAGPRGLPLLGNLLAFGRDQLGFLTSNARTYGDVVKFNFAGWPTLLLSDMDEIEKVLVKDHRNFVKNEVVWRHVRALFGQGLLTSEGDFWHRQRRLAAPAFAGRQLLAYDRDIVALTEATIAGWRAGQLFDVHPAMMALTLRIAARTLFDAEIEADIETIEYAVNDLLREIEARFKRPILISDAIPLPGHLRYRRAIRSIEAVIARLVAERRRAGVDGRADVLSRLMASRDDRGNPMSDAVLRDEAMTMLLAGHETTALALSWSFHLLGVNPDQQSRIGEEAEAAASGRPLISADIDRLPFTEAVVKETLRLYPPAWIIGRESVSSFEVRGERFGPKTTVLVAPWLLHRDSRYFEEPEIFRPERWLDGLEARLPRFAFMPFGGGPRICIGQRFAMFEAILILATIMRRHRVERQADRVVAPFPSITLRPRGGVWISLTEEAAVRH